MLDCANGFIEETAELREGNQNLLLVLDGRENTAQFSFLDKLRENGIIVVVFPSYTSEDLQQSDASVLSCFKSYVRREIHE